MRRRIEVDPRYSNRQLFADERGVNYRTISDIERGRRDNYEDATIASLEVAYAVRPGSIRRAVAGGELEPVPSPLRSVASAPPPADSPSERALADLLAAYPDDDVIAAMAAQRRKAPSAVVAEIYRWLDFIAAQEGRGEHGASAGLPDGNAKK